jgi:hypothetical protein
MVNITNQKFNPGDLVFMPLSKSDIPWVGFVTKTKFVNSTAWDDETWRYFVIWVHENRIDETQSGFYREDSLKLLVKCSND